MCANLAHRYDQVAMPSVITKENDDDFKLPQCSLTPLPSQKWATHQWLDYDTKPP